MASPTAQQIRRWKSIQDQPQRTATFSRTQTGYKLAYRNHTLTTYNCMPYEVGHAIAHCQRYAKANGFTHFKHNGHTHPL